MISFKKLLIQVWMNDARTFLNISEHSTRVYYLFTHSIQFTYFFIFFKKIEKSNERYKLVKWNTVTTRPQSIIKPTSCVNPRHHPQPLREPETKNKTCVLCWVVLPLSFFLSLFLQFGAFWFLFFSNRSYHHSLLLWISSWRCDALRPKKRVNPILLPTPPISFALVFTVSPFSFFQFYPFLS